ncbi:beta-1,4-mannosyltransferase [Microbacterium sp. BE35]|uniref:hypothetical protein n=1 Tax=Microbacterium sp. BE35 TaxID=2817773 RepID=UPI002863C0B7|nr:hypothetical protein [Microbacterium sp. BE35]MDR7188705.1 beta-1,4-mannosyltransferase [Microbacterium sp. BE35]
MPRPLQVMMSFTRPTETSSPYVQLLIRALEEEGVEVHYLSWPALVTGRVRLLHIHWPETMLKRRTAIGRVANRAFMATLLMWARSGRTQVVRTVHNSVPHESPGRADRWLLGRLDAATHARIYLTAPATEAVGDSVVLPHAELGSWYVAQAAEPVPTPSAKGPDVLFFGLVRPYKGIEHLVRLADDAPDLTVRIIGAPADSALAELVDGAVSSHTNLSSELRHVPDPQLVAEIIRARLVVLPYEKFENSGAAALAMDLGVPVLVPACGPTRELQALFGPEWVHLYEPPLRADEVRRTIRGLVEAGSAQRPIVEVREWPHQAKVHIELYESVLG